MKQSSKKNPAKGARPQTIKQRAQAIITDLEGYDADTRESIRVALEHNDSDLTELVASAERGDTILDLIHVARQHEQAAVNLVTFMASSPKHDFITDALVDAIVEAGRVHHVASMEGHESKEEQIKIMTRFFSVVPPMYSQRSGRFAQAHGDELKAFAHHLAEALRIARFNPLIPASLYNGLADALNDFENDLPSLARVSESELHILITLEAYQQQTAEGIAKGGKR